MEFSFFLMLIFISSIIVDAQEFKFTASCSNSQLTTSADNKSCKALNDKIDKLLLSLANDDKTSISVNNGTRSVLKDYLED